VRKIISGLIPILGLFLVFSIPAYADRNRVHTEFYIGVGHPGCRGHHPHWRHPRWRHHPRVPRYHWGATVVLRPWHTYSYRYYASPPVIVQEEPSVYIQREEEEPYYWYYCPDPQGYYPYVRTCPGGWMKVVPEVRPPDP